MTYPTANISNGPSEQGLDSIYAARKYNAKVQFHVIVDGGKPVEVYVTIINFDYCASRNPRYKIGGIIDKRQTGVQATLDRLPPFNFLYIEYDGIKREGAVMFSNAE